MADNAGEGFDQAGAMLRLAAAIEQMGQQRPRETFKPPTYDGEGDMDKAGVFCVSCSLFPAIHRDGSRRAEYFVTKV